MVTEGCRPVQRSAFVLLVPRHAGQPRLRRSVGSIHRLRVLGRRADSRGIAVDRGRRSQCKPARHRPAVRHVIGGRVLRLGSSVHAGKAGWTTGGRKHWTVRLLVLGHGGTALLHNVRLLRPQRLACADRILYHRKQK